MIAIVCLAYIFLRLWNLTESCLWFDEIFSIHAAEHSWSGLFWFAAQDLIHPPLFYVLLKLWIAIGGESLFWLRLFPVLFSVAALFPFFLLCRQFKLSNSTIALAATFLALNGSLIKYAQEVRMYSLLMCASLFSLWLFARFLNVGKGIWFLTLVNILLVHTQYFGWLVVVGEIFTVLYLQRRGRESRRKKFGHFAEFGLGRTSRTGHAFSVCI
jgi:mannosyltransferase